MKQSFKETYSKIEEIPEGWDRKPFEELPIDIIDGDRGVNYPSKSEFNPSGFCLFLSTKNTPGEGFDFSECEFISKERDLLLRKGKLRRKDIILTTRGSVGNVALYDENIIYENIRINSGMVIIRNRETLFDTKYLYQLIKSPVVKNQFSDFSTGSAQPQLPIRDIKRIELVIPSLPEQRSIAKILSDLDEKIELNNKMNKTLEEIGKAIFKRWFVDFEFPWNFKTGEVDLANGKPYKSNGGKMVASELGEIPEGWGVEFLGEYVDTVKGCSYSSDDLQVSDIALVTLKSIERGGGFKNTGYKEYIGKYKEEQIIADGEIVIAHTDLTQNAEVIGRPAIVRNTSKYKKLIASLDLAIVRPKENSAFNRSFLYFLFKTDSFTNHTYGYSNGSTVLHLNSQAISKYNTIIPNRKLLDVLGSVADNLINQMNLNNIESENIVIVRDSLLPKLMSGKIRVK